MGIAHFNVIRILNWQRGMVSFHYSLFTIHYLAMASWTHVSNLLGAKRNTDTLSSEN